MSPIQKTDGLARIAHLPQRYCETIYHGNRLRVKGAELRRALIERAKEIRDREIRDRLFDNFR